MKQTLPTPSAPKALRPYSHMVQAGDWIYLSGQIPIDPATGEIVEGGIQAQTQRVLDTIEALLSDVGLSTDHIVKTTIYITNMADFGAINALYAERFRAPYPARATVEDTAREKDRKSTRLNSSHVAISYAVFCLKKKKK